MLSVETLKSLRLCWSADELDDAAELWPADPTWAWFLGERLHTMTRKETLERLSVAITYAHGRGLVLHEGWPWARSYGEQWRWAKTAAPELVWPYLAALGDAIDADDAAREAVAQP